MEMTMHLYLLDVYMDETKHDFRLVIDGDDSSSETGRWSVTPPGDFFLSGLDGKWRLMREPSFTMFVLWPGGPDDRGKPFPAQGVSSLNIDGREAIRQQGQSGRGRTGDAPGRMGFSCKVLQCFF
jgi:hypothetical protein